MAHFRTQCDRPGFGDLSDGAKEIARYYDAHEGNISALLKEKPELLDSFDEYHYWSAVTLAEIERQEPVAQATHSLKNLFKKKK